MASAAEFLAFGYSSSILKYIPKSNQYRVSPRSRRNSLAYEVNDVAQDLIINVNSIIDIVLNVGKNTNSAIRNPLGDANAVVDGGKELQKEVGGIHLLRYQSAQNKIITLTIDDNALSYIMLDGAQAVDPGVIAVPAGK